MENEITFCLECGLTLEFSIDEWFLSDEDYRDITNFWFCGIHDRVHKINLF